MSGWMKLVIGLIVLASAIAVFKDKFGDRFGWSSDSDTDSEQVEHIEERRDERLSGAANEAVQTSNLSAEVGGRKSMDSGVGSGDRARGVVDRASEE